MHQWYTPPPGKLSPNIKNTQMTLKQEKCGWYISEKNLEAPPKQKIEQEKKLDIFYLYWPINKSEKSRLIK